MKTINLSLLRQEDFSYSIYIEQGILTRLSDYLSHLFQGNKYLIITDSNVEKLYGNNILESMIESGFETYLFAFPAGEKQKNIDTKIDIESYMFQKKFGRDSVIIALGGGVVGDLSGFTASTFNRGIPYIQIPTTLLAQVDSSIGGKTAIDVSYGKNLIGTFYQPK
ncbi:MAG TPA: iron-containing alcohol dehydrogenase, partial [Spirochaetes bacterium]|nr:iron-containing alcohol dehydrogenase [Spirochaetota bacterium]